MSAITGIGDSTTIRLSASTSVSRGTAQRTRSPPACATAWIWRMVASKSAVSVFVIDCTATGAPPPIFTPPTSIWRLLAIGSRVLAAGVPVALSSAQPPGLLRRLLIGQRRGRGRDRGPVRYGTVTAGGIAPSEGPLLGAIAPNNGPSPDLDRTAGCRTATKVTEPTDPPPRCPTGQRWTVGDEPGGTRRGRPNRYPSAIATIPPVIPAAATSR